MDEDGAQVRLFSAPYLGRLRPITVRTMADEAETYLPGGSISGASRVGETVRRETGPWTPTIHALLNHLEAVGFAGSPRVLGIDERGREVLSYMEGDSATHPWPEALREAAGMRAMGGLIRAFHDAVRDFVPPEDAVFRVGQHRLASGEIVCHGDLGYWNTIWRDGEAVGIIDWDFAEPATPLRDLAQAAIYDVPLRADKHCFAAGFEAVPDRRARLRALCDGYGDVEPEEVLAAAAEVQALEIARLDEFGAAGIEPWKSFSERGQAAWLQLDADWIAANGDRLL
jgi:hypothetical protein